MEVISFPDPLALESEAENLSRLEVLHTGVPRRFAKEEEGIRVWSVEGLDLEDIDVERPAQNVAGTWSEHTRKRART